MPPKKKKNSYGELKSFSSLPATIQKSISMTTATVDDAQIIGSFAQASLPWWSDVDVNSPVNMTYEELAQVLQQRFQSLASDRDIHFSDFKVGDRHFSLNEVRSLGSTGLADLMAKGGIIKLDVIFSAEDRFVEQLTFFVVVLPPSSRERPNVEKLSKRELERQVAKDGLHYALDKGNYLKAIKWAWSIARLEDDEEVLDMLHPLLLSDIQRLSVVRSDIETTILLLDKGVLEERPAFRQMQDEVNAMKNRVIGMTQGVSEKARHLILLGLDRVLAQTDTFALRDALAVLEAMVAHTIAVSFASSPFASLGKWVLGYLKRFT